MHMADALLSPAVGGALLAVSAAGVGWSARRVRAQAREEITPLMGVLGAFVFAAQMINFSIPGTGSSGHLGGGLLLAILLGPAAAFLVIASVLTVQALLFADGGLLALGCNLFNMGFLPCFVAYPLIYRPIAGERPTTRRIQVGVILAAIVALQLGALAVVLETTLSGISALPFGPFAMVMLPIHLAIGLVEGLVTAAVVLFLGRERPELLQPMATRPIGLQVGRALASLAVTAALTAGILSWFASAHPDGLEWSIARATGGHEVAEPADGLHRALARVQSAFALLPDYDFRRDPPATAPPDDGSVEAPLVQAGTSAAGVVGATLTLGLAGAAGLVLRRRKAGR